MAATEKVMGRLAITAAGGMFAIITVLIGVIWGMVNTRIDTNQANVIAAVKDLANVVAAQQELVTTLKEGNALQDQLLGILVEDVRDQGRLIEALRQWQANVLARGSGAP